MTKSDFDPYLAAKVQTHLNKMRALWDSYRSLVILENLKLSDVEFQSLLRPLEFGVRQCCAAIIDHHTFEEL